MRKFILAILMALSILSCTNRNQFQVRGTIKGEDSTMLYLERNGLDGLLVLDSVKLNAKGDFVLKGEKPKCPEFYRLRFGSKWIPFSMTAEESSVKIEVDSFPSYKVDGSEANQKIAQIVSLVNTTNSQISAEMESFAAKELQNRDSLEAKIMTCLKVYKDSIRKIIYDDTKSPAAYFAIFQRLSYNINPFSALDKADLKVYSAVATAWNVNYKECARTKQMLNMIDQARKDMKQAVLDKLSKEHQSGFVDLSLPNKQGEKVLLSSLKGNYILLDFCAYSQMSSDDILLLKDMYSKNKSKGFEIYQVSYDKDSNFWKKTVSDFSWVCVRDTFGASVSTYNIASLPANYLIDKQGNIIAKNVRWDRISSLLD